MNTITANTYTATEYLSGSWTITGPSGQMYYRQGSAADIASFLQSLPPILPSSGPLLPSANVGQLPDGSTQIESLQQDTVDRQNRRAQLEPDYITDNEKVLYGNVGTAGSIQLSQLEADVINWNLNLNNLRAQNGLQPLPPSAFDGAPLSPVYTTFMNLPTWAPYAAIAGGIGLFFLLTRE